MKAINKSIKSRSKTLTCSCTNSPIKKEGLVYERDFSKWTENQAKLLKKGEFEKLDIEHLIEEIRDLGKREKQMLISYLENLLNQGRLNTTLLSKGQRTIRTIKTLRTPIKMDVLLLVSLRSLWSLLSFVLYLTK